jgi:hypothetical protein
MNFSFSFCHVAQITVAVGSTKEEFIFALFPFGAGEVTVLAFMLI